MKRAPLVAGAIGVLFAVSIMVAGAWFQGAQAARYRFDFQRFDPLRAAAFRFARSRRRGRLSSRASLARCFLRRVAIPRTPPPASPYIP